MGNERSTAESAEKPSLVQIEEGFDVFVPEEFKEDPVGYFEREGKNIKLGEVKKDETGRVREDPTAVKDLPVWRSADGKELATVAKRVSFVKGAVGKSGDPLYEFKVMEIVKKKGLPVANPIAQVEQGGTHLIVMEKIDGVRWTDKNYLPLIESGCSEEDIEDLKRQAEEKMAEMKTLFESKGVQRGWKLKDMIFQIDIPNKKILKVIPTDWERTEIVDEGSRGFSLLSIIIVIAIISLMAWGGKNFYGDYFKQEKSVMESRTDSIDAANALKSINDARRAEIQKELNQ